MLLYLQHRNSKLFFHLAKFDDFKDEKISDFKTVSVYKVKWDYEQLLREVFFYVFWAKDFLKVSLKIP